MLCDPDIAAVVPPWGGEMEIDLLDQLDWAALAAAEPTWLVGWSDICTVMLPLTLRLGWATLHGWNLMDTRYDAPDGLLHWTDLAAATGPGDPDQPRPLARGLGRLPHRPRRRDDDAGPGRLLDGAWRR